MLTFLIPGFLHVRGATGVGDGRRPCASWARASSGWSAPMHLTFSHICQRRPLPLFASSVATLHARHAVHPRPARCEPVPRSTTRAHPFLLKSCSRRHGGGLLSHAWSSRRSWRLETKNGLIPLHRNRPSSPTLTWSGQASRTTRIHDGSMHDPQHHQPAAVDHLCAGVGSAGATLEAAGPLTNRLESIPPVSRPTSLV